MDDQIPAEGPSYGKRLGDGCMWAGILIPLVLIGAAPVLLNLADFIRYVGGN